MAVVSDLPNFDGLGIAQLIKNKEISYQDVCETTFYLIDKLNPKLNAVVRPMKEQASQIVSQCDNQSNVPESFSGVPIVLKDEYLSYANMPNDHSSMLGQGFTRSYHTHLVEKYLQAGMMVVGKANLPELGASVTTDAKLYGPCKNPWNVDYNSGGSSGGSSSAVAAGIVPVAYANDGAGSIRIPASCCGLFGLKPTRGRVSTAPDGGEYWNGLVIEHAVTRSVRDSAHLLDITAGYQPGDFYCAPPQEESYLNATSRPPKPLRIAFSAQPPYEANIDPECISAIHETAKLCEELGHNVEECSPKFDGEAMRLNLTKLLQIHLAYGIDDLASHFKRPINKDLIENSTFELAMRGKSLGAVEFLGVLESFTQLSRELASFWQMYDVLLTPTLASPSVKNGFIYTDDPDPDRYLKRFFDFIPFTPIANIIGHPAMTVPLGMSSSGLPIGSQFIGRFGDEVTLLQLAIQLESASPWISRKPTVSAWAEGIF
ncbi:amidase [Alteromonas oceanisediminis]|uniref:amidase n=1 Tax=Alteromonas oceanisediminis TaxID=2836180 RepID=UPI001BDAAB72|nr:amidase [Alteromonas oceanisediminis]MBT0585167.1 amidase [Alteromonas oceanisediminis]